MLGVPPAFVLSQDQTLHKFVSPSRSLRFEIWFIAHESLAITVRFIVLSDFSKYNAEQISSFRIDQGFQFYSCLFFSRIVQFSRCSRCRFQGACLVRRLIYYTTFQEVCQAFFQSFLKNFFRTAPNLSYSELLSAVPLGQLASFSIIPHFQKFVKRFLKVFNRRFS